ncbi:hypothetical protein AHAS_Ahas01G0119700 [Arachis hypogaea]
MRGSVGEGAGLGELYEEEIAKTQWTSWLVPMFVVAKIAVFILAMQILQILQGNCVARFLGRISFQPLRENPLLGPSSST